MELAVPCSCSGVEEKLGITLLLVRPDDIEGTVHAAVGYIANDREAFEETARQLSVQPLDSIDESSHKHDIDRTRNAVNGWAHRLRESDLG